MYSHVYFTLLLVLKLTSSLFYVWHDPSFADPSSTCCVLEWSKFLLWRLCFIFL